MALVPVLGAEFELPMQLRMAQDSEEEPFLSSLKAFASRTCLANSSGKSLLRASDPKTP